MSKREKGEKRKRRRKEGRKKKYVRESICTVSKEGMCDSIKSYVVINFNIDVVHMWAILTCFKLVVILIYFVCCFSLIW